MKTDFDTKLRTVGSIAFAANQSPHLDLFRKNPNVALHLDYDIQMAITGDLTLRDEHILNAIASIEVMANDTTIQKWSPGALLFYNYILNGVVDEMIALTPTTSAGSPGNGRCRLTIPFILPKTGLPNRSLMPAGQLDSFRVRINFGAADQSDVASAGAGTIQNTTIQVSQEEIDTDNLEGLGAPFERVLVRSLFDTFAAADEEAVFSNGLPTAKRIRGLIIRASDEATGLVLSDTLLNGFRIEDSDTKVRIRSTWDRMKHTNMNDHKLAEDFPFGSPGVESGRTEGYVFVDFAKHGPAYYLDPRLLDRMDILIDTDANSRADVTMIQVTDPFPVIKSKGN